MRKLVAALAAVVAFSASAGEATEIDLVLKTPDTSVRLTGAPCALMVAALGIMQTIPTADVRMAHVIHRGRDFQACWAKDDENDVLVVLDNGGHGWFPLAAFKSESGV